MVEACQKEESEALANKLINDKNALIRKNQR